ncbi:hypothetical protein NIES2109_31140 [Nostoc sp. HK-01]|uniref:Uncharacterized protein n=2 Tax=Nostocales TaxID=1161 RepID=A0A1Z4GDH6_9CYAN|nr:hypothetical protein [Nostoc cycadae]BAY15560.1 hypothetical protein NIES21_13770 [Anabaenopsis circularis NIES-21]BBD60317.1 hypothetical protein NIES2109_31140 [Nostoc sp. HK-01]GBE94878.1 CopG family transcriptional regulator [Nostoc cycadae WK-1]
MNILVTPEDEQLHKFRSELGKYTNTQEVINTPLKVIEEYSHRPADINQKITREDEHACCQMFRDRSMAEGCDHTEYYIYSELVEK